MTERFMPQDLRTNPVRSTLSAYQVGIQFPFMGMIERTGKCPRKFEFPCSSCRYFHFYDSEASGPFFSCSPLSAHNIRVVRNDDEHIDGSMGITFIASYKDTILAEISISLPPEAVNEYKSEMKVTDLSKSNMLFPNLQPTIFQIISTSIGNGTISLNLSST